MIKSTLFSFFWRNIGSKKRIVEYSFRVVLTFQSFMCKWDLECSLCLVGGRPREWLGSCFKVCCCQWQTRNINLTAGEVESNHDKAPQPAGKLPRSPRAGGAGDMPDFGDMPAAGTPRTREMLLCMKRWLFPEVGRKEGSVPRMPFLTRSPPRSACLVPIIFLDSCYLYTEYSLYYQSSPVLLVDFCASLFS